MLNIMNITKLSPISRLTAFKFTCPNMFAIDLVLCYWSST